MLPLLFKNEHFIHVWYIEKGEGVWSKFKKRALLYIWTFPIDEKRILIPKKNFLCLSLLLFVVTYHFDQYDMSSDSESERHERIHVFTRNPGRFATITCSPRVDSSRKVSRFAPLNRYYIIKDEVFFDYFWKLFIY